MKIVDVAEFYSDFGGGVRGYVRQKLAAGRALGVNIVIVAPGREDRIEYRDGGKIVWVKAPVIPVDTRYHLFTRAQPVHAILAAEKPDVVEGSSPWRGGWIAAGWKAAPVRSLFMHSDPVASYPHLVLGRFLPPERIDRLFGWFWRYMRRLDAAFDTTVVGGAWLAERLERQGLKPPAVVSMGVDKSLFRPDARSEAVRAEMRALCGLAADGRILLAVGRLHPEKRIDMLIEAMAASGPETGLLILGDGPSRRRIERLAARHAHVRLVGPVTDRGRLAAMMASADGLIHGCSSETFGLAVSEAISSGIPIVVPDRGGAFMAAAPDHAEIYAAGSKTACSTAIRRLLARDAAALNRAALEAAKSIPDSRAHFRNLFAHYAALLEAASAAKSR